MKKLRIISFFLLAAALLGFLLWRFLLSVPDWFVRADGVLMLAAISSAVFSSVRLHREKKESGKT